MKLSIRHSTEYHYSERVKHSTQYLRLTPRPSARQKNSQLGNGFAGDGGTGV